MTALTRNGPTSRLRELAAVASALPRRTRNFLTPLQYPGMQLTPKRLLNQYLVRFEEGRGHTKLHGSPLILTIESGNLCNLRCPYCHTGAGEVGRERSMFQIEQLRQLLDEMGDTLLQIEFYNWGEPLLNKNIAEMIQMASSRGIGSIISTNFSINYDAARAEELVASGLDTLGVSLDGASQESYEQYRRRGDLATVLRNVDLINEAKRKLRSKTPELVWEFHVFPHNRHEIETARRMAAEREMVYAVSLGRVVGEAWDKKDEFSIRFTGSASRCSFLWRRAVVHNDGGVAPCCGTFYREDDFGAIRSEPTVRLSEMDGRRFRDVWNNPNFVRSRQMFRSRDGASEADKRLICYSCPVTKIWEGYRRHIANGEPRATFDPGYVENDGMNFFFSRKETLRGAVAANPDMTIPLIALENISS